MSDPQDIVDVCIVGAGLSGIGMAHVLEKDGTFSYVVLERSHRIGGTWEANTYPGCRCDVPASLYSYADAPSPAWSSLYPLQEEIRAYIERCADWWNLRSRIRLETEATRCAFDPSSLSWTVDTPKGPIRARALVGAQGPLSTPAVPGIPGLARFAGPLLHTGRWDHTVPLAGRRIGLIGTGASAIQVLPHLQKEASALTLFQRTPAWVLPHPGREVGQRERSLYERLPVTLAVRRSAAYWGREALSIGFTRAPGMLRILERVANRHRERSITDPALRDALRPSYRIGCKRILLSNDYYPALSQDNVSLVTSPIERVTKGGIVSGGIEHPLDLIVAATGFRVTDPVFASRIEGRAGTLSQAWEDGMRAYCGITVPGFPNFFLLIGPNTGLGHNSMIVMMEAQFRYILGALRMLDAAGEAAIDVKEEALVAYEAEIQQKLSRSVWATGCSSWYLDANGRNTTLWPGSCTAYRKRARFDANDYRVIDPAREGHRTLPAHPHRVEVSA